MDFSQIKTPSKESKVDEIFNLLRQIVEEGAQLVDKADPEYVEFIVQIMTSSSLRISSPTHKRYLMTLPEARIDMDLQMNLEALNNIHRLAK